MSKNFELLQQIGKEQNLFQTSGNMSAAVKIVECEPAATVEIALPEAQPKKLKKPNKPNKPNKPKMEIRWPELRWPEVVKEKAKSWIRETPRANPSRLSESGKITRREEIKLVQRIFPAGPLGTQRAPQVVAFSGVEHGHAASDICARSCEILANRDDGPVCAVDASFGSPSLHRYFGMENRRGLSEALCDSTPVQEFIHNIKNSKLWIMPVGSANLELTGNEIANRLTERMAELRTFFKYVVIHSPVYSDRAAAPHSFGADGLVLVVEANCTRREAVREVMEELRLQGTPILGVVLNNRTFPIPDAIYHKL